MFDTTSACETVSPVQQFVTMAPDCTIDVRMMCNGILNCDGCVDEIFESCMQVECRDGTSTAFFPNNSFDVNLLL